MERFLFAIIITLIFSQHIAAYSLTAQEKLVFWSRPTKGANMMNELIDEEDIKAAKKLKIDFIKLNLEKFPATNRDFLIGNADDYDGLVVDDLNLLKRTLDMFHAEKMPVVLTMGTLPGCRGVLTNNGQDDFRIWYLEKYQRQAAKFWSDLARELKGHPAVIGINIIHRPAPEKLFFSKNKGAYDIDHEQLQKFLYNFYHEIIAKIRKIDRDVPIVIDSSGAGDPSAFQYLLRHNIPGIMYSFYTYEPVQYTNVSSNNKRLTYPGVINDVEWNKEKLRAHLAAVKSFQTKYQIPNSHIIVGGFGCDRFVPGASDYLRDWIDVFSEFGWHTAFSYFRSDIDDNMDYELGDKKLPWSYYNARESGIRQKPPRENGHKIFQVIVDSLNLE